MPSQRPLKNAPTGRQYFPDQEARRGQRSANSDYRPRYGGHTTGSRARSRSPNSRGASRPRRGFPGYRPDGHHRTAAQHPAEDPREQPAPSYLGCAGGNSSAVKRAGGLTRRHRFSRAGPEHRANAGHRRCGNRRTLRRRHRPQPEGGEEGLPLKIREPQSKRQSRNLDVRPDVAHPEKRRGQREQIGRAHV